MNLLRHAEIEAEQKKEEKVRKLKKNLKLLMIALIVLAIEKLSEFITALISSQTSGEIEVKKSCIETQVYLDNFILISLFLFFSETK